MCSLAAQMLLLKMLLAQDVLFPMANMVDLNLLILQNPELELKKEVQVH